MGVLPRGAIRPIRRVRRRAGLRVSPARGSRPKVTATVTVGKGPDDVAVDSVGKLVYVTNSGDDTVSVIDASSSTSRAVVQTSRVGRTPDGWVADPSTQTAYITNSQDDSMSVVDPQARKTTATVKVGKSPDGIAVDTATRIVNSANEGDGTVSVVTVR